MFTLTSLLDSHTPPTSHSIHEIETAISNIHCTVSDLRSPTSMESLQALSNNATVAPLVKVLKFQCAILPFIVSDGMVAEIITKKSFDDALPPGFARWLRRTPVQGWNSNPYNHAGLLWATEQADGACWYPSIWSVPSATDTKLRHPVTPILQDRGQAEQELSQFLVDCLCKFTSLGRVEFRVCSRKRWEVLNGYREIEDVNLYTESVDDVRQVYDGVVKGRAVLLAALRKTGFGRIEVRMD
ncbi:hypothetical protein P154DRAFT_533340 [Amniculicola lignicola CBS 123094]|uniref:Uncharacterized protein n=1 Tax=Amniculicola lignicola CBS 123094 TaxID=1392246 RepID=A0A6A5WJM1_9PLEO|nr:hypothetical protein P154DRAFT_533340 [Amniculicola lignicola CBS 123094]